MRSWRNVNKNFWPFRRVASQGYDARGNWVCPIDSPREVIPSQSQGNMDEKEEEEKKDSGKEEENMKRGGGFVANLINTAKTVKQARGQIRYSTKVF